MAVKGATDPAAHIAFLLSSFSHADGEIKIDWNMVATENNINYARNASTKFKETLKKYGYKFEGNKIIQANGTDSAAIVPATPKPKESKAKKTHAKKTTAKKNSGESVIEGSAKKRKLAAVEAEDDGDAATDDMEEDKEENGDDGGPQHADGDSDLADNEVVD